MQKDEVRKKYMNNIYSQTLSLANILLNSKSYTV